MTVEVDEAAVAAADDAAFTSGFPEKPPEKAPAKARRGKPAAEEPAEPPAAAEELPAVEPAAAKPEPPKFVQISENDWNEVRAAAAKTASYDAQLSKAFGTIGNLQKLVTGLQSATPAGRKVEIPKGAFDKMARDFPELAELNREALENALAGMTGTAPGVVDPEAEDARLEAKLAAREAKRELKVLDEEYPDWRTIVGAVNVRENQQPDPNNPYRKWLATKPPAYQERLNNSESAAVITNSIRLFQSETKAAGKPAVPARPRDEARAARIAGAIQPRGDNGGAAAGPSEDDEFEAGFRGR